MGCCSPGTNEVTERGTGEGKPTTFSKEWKYLWPGVGGEKEKWYYQGRSSSIKSLGCSMKGGGWRESLSALTLKILSHPLYWFSLDPSCHFVIESLTPCDPSVSLISQRGHFWSSDKLISFRCWVCERASLMDTLHMVSHLTGTHNGTTEPSDAAEWQIHCQQLYLHFNSSKLPGSCAPHHPEDLSKLDSRVAGQGGRCLCGGHSSSQGTELIDSRNS